MKVSDIMSDRVVTIDRREPVIAAARLLKRMNLGALPVTDRSGKLVGMLSLADMARKCDMEAAAALADISSNLRRLNSDE